MITEEIRDLIRIVVREEMAAQGWQTKDSGHRLCVVCEGSFPEAALNYSSGDPFCVNCQARCKPGLARDLLR